MDHNEIKDGSYELFQQSLDGRGDETEVDRFMRLAAETGDLELQTHVSLDAVISYSYCGQHVKCLKAFAFCLANRSLIDASCHELLLVGYITVIGNAANLPQITFKTIQSMEQELCQIVEDAGYNVGHVLCEGWVLRTTMGRLEEAWEIYQEWDTKYRDRRNKITKCQACLDHNFIKLQINRGENEIAIKLVDELIASDLRCGSIPKETHAVVLLPLMRLGNTEKAKHHHEEGIKLLDQMCIYTLSMHLIFLLHLGQRDKVRQLLEENLLAAVETQSVENRLFMYRAAWFLCELDAADGRSDCKLRLPSSIGCFRSSQKYSNSELEDWFRTASLKMIKQYDERNGTRFYMQSNDECRQLIGLEPFLGSWD